MTNTLFDGKFGVYGGRYVAEILMPPLLQLEQAYNAVKNDASFAAEIAHWQKHYVGRPSPLYHAQRMSDYAGGAAIYFKRDELNHTGAHKINNTLAQVLLARRMGKTRIIAETGAGQHGVATAAVCAKFGLPCTVYMGAVDTARQQQNVFRMRLLGAEVVPVDVGAATLKEAMNEALRAWAADPIDTFYVIGTAAGPHPYPQMVRDFQSIIGQEVREQAHEMCGKLPDALVACIGGGSNALGLFAPFLNDPSVAMYAVEAAGKGLDTPKHAASVARGRTGVLHGNKTLLLCDDDGQVLPTYSISAGLDYPGIGPEHAHLAATGRVKYLSATDEDALNAFALCCKLEGIIPALEPSHALARALDLAATMTREQMLVVNICGRGDKDLHTANTALGF